MATGDIGKYAKSFGLAFAITSFVSALLVIVKETNEETVLKLMADITGHHWITHGLFDIVLFALLGWVLSFPNKGKGVNISTDSLIGAIVVSVVVSGLLIAGFYF